MPSLKGNSTAWIWEDIALGGAITYAAGGVTVTCAVAQQVQTVRFTALKAPTGTAAGTNLLVAPVIGSESGLTFKMKAYQAGGTAAAFAELAAASAALQNLTVTVAYDGSA